MEEISPVANRYLGTMRDLDEFTRTVFGVPVIDHDFAPKHQPLESSPGSLLGFSREINSLAEEISDDELNGDVMRRNLESLNFVFYALAAERRFNNSSEYLNHVEHTMGVRPSMVPVDSLADQRQAIEQTVADMGYYYGSEDRASFNAAHSIPAEDMQETVEGLVDAAKDYVAKIVGSTLIQGLNGIEIIVADFEDTWEGFFGVENEKFITKINSNPLLKISRPYELAVLVHELTHGLSSTTKKQKVAQGELSPAMGIMPSFSPMYFQEEVAARSAEEDLLTGQTGILADYIYKSMKYKNDVHTNMMIMANSGFFSEDEVAVYGIGHLPFDEPDKIKKDAELYTNKLLYKTVFAVDGEALRAGRRIAALPAQEKRDTIVRLCSQPVETAELLVA